MPPVFSVVNTLETLSLKRKFLTLEDVTARDSRLIPLFQPISIKDFYLHCQLDPRLPYGEAVYRKCRQAVMYVLHAIGYGNSMGKYNLQEVKVVEGKVWGVQHSWLLFRDTYTVDLTLAQFTPNEVSQVAILTLEDGREVYQQTKVFTWQEWVELPEHL